MEANGLLKKSQNLFSNISMLIVWLVIFCTAIGAAVLFYLGDSFEGWVGLAALVVFIFFQLILPGLASMSNPAFMRLIISCTMVSSLTAGRYLYLYQRITHFDKSQHVLYGIVLVIISLVLLYRLLPADNRSNPQIHPVALAIFLIGSTMLLLFIWELFEFICDRQFGSDMQAWKAGGISGLTDTMIDQLMGLIGALASSTIIALFYARDRAAFYSKWLSGFFPQTSSKTPAKASAAVLTTIAVKKQDSMEADYE
jgi:hypothetical protein